MDADQVSPGETSTTRHGPDFLFLLAIQLSCERSLNNDQLGMQQEPQAAQSTRIQDHSETFGGFMGKWASTVIPWVGQLVNYANLNLLCRHMPPHFRGDAEAWPESRDDVVSRGVEQGFVHWLQLWRLVKTMTSTGNNRFISF